MQTFKLDNTKTQTKSRIERQERSKREREERKQEMIRLRTVERMTLRQIGSHCGITHERVRQIIGGIPRPKPQFSFICLTCGKENIYEAYRRQKRKYCNKECQSNRPLKFGMKPSDDPKEYSRRQNRVRYKDPVKYMKHKFFQKRYYQKVMADPKKRKARSEYQNKLQSRLAQDPEWKERRNARARMYHRNKREDLIKKHKYER